jgi:hypothetical protein
MLRLVLPETLYKSNPSLDTLATRALGMIGKKINSAPARRSFRRRRGRAGGGFFQYLVLTLSLILLLAPVAISGGSGETLQALFNYGTQAISAGDPETAIIAFNKILAANPDIVSARYNLAYTYKIMGHPDQAIPLYQEILAQQPDHESARLGLAFAYLSNGDYMQGWRAHEWNLKKQGKFAPELRALLASNSLAGHTVLLVPEGGLGDTLQFFKYGKKLKDLGATVIALVQAPLKQLLSRSASSYCQTGSGTDLDFSVDIVINKLDPIPAHHARITYMSLPATLYLTESELAHNTPYIFPDPELLNYWATHIDPTKFNIGLCWQADVYNDSSRLTMARRGIPLAAFDQLKNACATVSGSQIQFYSIQKREGLDQLAALAPDFPLHIFDDTVFDEDHGPFMDTAALISHLDLVITIDSAVAHLAGALGKPVWLLLPYVTDWRWLAHRQDSPWYPTMRIFQQPAPFDWNSVIKEVHAALANTRSPRPLCVAD